MFLFLELKTLRSSGAQVHGPNWLSTGSPGCVRHVGNILPNPLVSNSCAMPAEWDKKHFRHSTQLWPATFGRSNDATLEFSRIQNQLKADSLPNDMPMSFKTDSGADWHSCSARYFYLIFRLQGNTWRPTVWLLIVNFFRWIVISLTGGREICQKRGLCMCSAWNAPLVFTDKSQENLGE